MQIGQDPGHADLRRRPSRAWCDGATSRPRCAYLHAANRDDFEGCVSQEFLDGRRDAMSEMQLSNRPFSQADERPRGVGPPLFGRPPPDVAGSAAMEQIRYRLSRKPTSRSHETDHPAGAVAGVRRHRRHRFRVRGAPIWPGSGSTSSDSNAGSGAVFRVIPTKIMTIEQLGLPTQLRKLASVRRPAWSSSPAPPARASRPPWRRSSTSSTRPGAATSITIEDPIEFVHPNKNV